MSCKAPSQTSYYSVYVNDIYRVSNFLQPVVFSDATNLFLYGALNLALKEINIWFSANTFSVNENKTKYTLVHTARKRDTIPSKLLTPITDKNKEASSVCSIEFLVVILDENLSWNRRMRVIETKYQKAQQSCIKQRFLLLVH